MRNKLIVYMLSIVLITSMIGVEPVFGWYGSDLNPYGSYYDVHEDDTEMWCIDKGMDDDWADEVADHCASVDILFKSNYRWHLDRRNFTGQQEDTRILQSKNEMILAKRKLNEVVALTAAYNKSTSRLERLKLYTKLKKAKYDAVLYLGRSLHPIQDIYAHMDAGINTPDSKIGISHGMLDAPKVEVRVIYPNNSEEIRSMPLETQNSSGTMIYSMYDDINYDYVDGSWVFKQEMKKEENSRWLKTRDASYALIDEFLQYANKLGIDYTTD